MRKLIIFLMVLAFAPAASALSVWFETGGSAGTVNVSASTAYTIDVVADFTVAGFNVGAITQDNGTVSAVGDLNSELKAQDPWNNGELKDGSVNNIVIFQITGGVGLNDNVAANTVLYSFSLTTPSVMGTVLIEDWTGTNPFGGAPFPVVTDITGSGVTDLGGLLLVPEPMTIVLLGLGGLFLRRRK